MVEYLYGENLKDGPLNYLKVNIMKQVLWIIIGVWVTLSACGANGKGVDLVKSITTNLVVTDSTTKETRMKIKIGTKTFTAILENNPSAETLSSLLPLTIKMIELNGNEKYADLPRSLPGNSANPGTIQSGDIMLYQGSTIVIFYKKFLTSYSYTKLGRVDNAEGLAAALGSGDVTVSFEQD